MLFYWTQCKIRLKLIVKNNFFQVININNLYTRYLKESIFFVQKANSVIGS